MSLTEAERDAPARQSKSQHHSERERARILLLADEAKEGGAAKDAAIAQRVKVAPTGCPPPEGHNRWSLRLPREALIEQQSVDVIGKETVRRTLKRRHFA